MYFTYFWFSAFIYLSLSLIDIICYHITLWFTQKRFLDINANRLISGNSIIRYMFNEIVEYSAGINGQEWVCLTAQHVILGFDRVRQSLHPRSISLLVTENLRIFKSCGAIPRIILAKTQSGQSDEAHISTPYKRRHFWMLRDSLWHEFSFPFSYDLLRNLFRRDFSSWRRKWKIIRNLPHCRRVLMEK